MIIYKIRSKKTGLFSKGGNDPRFSKTGKTWNLLNHISNHFNQLSSLGRKIYKDEDVEVCAYEISEALVSATPGSEWIEAAADRVKQRKAEQEQRIAEWRRQQDEEEFERLRKKLGK